MRGKITKIDVDGTETVKEYAAAIPLSDLQEGVGGYIEIIPAFDSFRGGPCVVFGNEEGKIRDLPVNVKATTHWRENVRTNDYLTGSVVIVTGDDEFMSEL